MWFCYYLLSIVSTALSNLSLFIHCYRHFNLLLDSYFSLAKRNENTSTAIITCWSSWRLSENGFKLGFVILLSEHFRFRILIRTWIAFHFIISIVIFIGLFYFLFVYFWCASYVLGFKFLEILDVLQILYWARSAG